MRPGRVLMCLLVTLELSCAALPHHHFGKKLIGKKIFKRLRALDKCEVIWEEVSHPHCQTTWEK